MTRAYHLIVAGALLGALAASQSFGQTEFAKQVGDVKVGPVAPMTPQQPLKVPFITWGGDIATFYANGGLKTASGTLFEKQGMNFELTAGDDFAQQVKDYISGKSPFLRGTVSMMGMASEIIGANEQTKGVMFLQLTWSLGDHMIGRKEFKNLNELKGKTICLQQGGPHVGMLNDLLDTANLTWDDIKVVWAKDLTGSKQNPNDNPAAMFRKDSKIDACFCISPDMASLCGGLEKVGSKAVAGQVEGAHVVVSTATMSRSIADVYVCRNDFYQANKEMVTKFAAAYLKACDEVSDLQKAFQDKNGKKEDKDKYTKVCEMTQTIYGKEAIPTLEDADGLLSDCDFAGYKGNVKYFTWGTGNTVGFEAMQKKALDLAVAQQYANRRVPLLKPDFDYKSNVFVGYLADTKVDVPQIAEARPGDINKLVGGGGVEDNTLISFNILFEPNQNEFPEEKYRQEFDRVVKTKAIYGNAALIIRGHTDPLRFYTVISEAGKQKGLITIPEDPLAKVPGYTYKGEPFDVEKVGVKRWVDLVQSGDLEGSKGTSPKLLLTRCQQLSDDRAAAVRNAIVKYAQAHKLVIDGSLLLSQGMGIAQPAVAWPRTDEECQKNRRVEFRLVKVQAETK